MSIQMGREKPVIKRPSPPKPTVRKRDSKLEKLLSELGYKNKDIPYLVKELGKMGKAEALEVFRGMWKP